MYSFLIKKTFFDMWDNLLTVFLLNVGFVFLVCGFFILPSLIGVPAGLLPYYSAAGVVVITYVAGGVSRFTLELADYKKGNFALFFRSLAHSWKQNLLTCGIVLILLTVFFIVLPYYLLSDSMIFVILGGILFWVWFGVFLVSLFFPPAAVRLKKKLLASLRDTVTFVSDNLGFCLIAFFIFLLAGILSAVFLFMIPGPVAMLLWINVCFKIRLYKYEYLRLHPGASRREIPWDELIAEDRKAVGKRTLRGMIFPWRE